MNIVINRNIDQELLSLKIKKEFQFRFQKRGKLLLLLGVGFLAFHYIDYANNKGNWDTADVGMAVVFLIFGGILLYTYYKYQKIFKDGAERSRKKYAELDVFSTTSITEDNFIYESVKSSIKLSWSSITGFKADKEHVILMTDAHTTVAFVIMLTEVEPQELNKLYAFLSKNIKLVK